MFYIVFCVIAILVISALIGLWRGLFRTLFGLIALVLSFAITYFCSPIVADYVIENTNIDEYIEGKIYSRLEASVEGKVKTSLKNAGVKEGLDTLTAEETKNVLETEPDKATQMQLIEDYNLPEIIRKSMIENNNDNMYKELGVTGFYKYVSSYSARLIINAGTFFVMLLVLRLILMVVNLLLRKFIMGIPILAGIDRAGGLVLGLFAGIFVIWVFMILAGFFFGAEYDSMVADSAFLTKLDETNLIMRLIVK